MEGGEEGKGAVPVGDLDSLKYLFKLVTVPLFSPLWRTHLFLSIDLDLMALHFASTPLKCLYNDRGVTRVILLVLMHIQGLLSLGFFYSCWLGSIMLLPLSLFLAAMQISFIPLYIYMGYIGFRIIQPLKQG